MELNSAATNAWDVITTVEGEGEAVVVDTDVLTIFDNPNGDGELTLALETYDDGTRHYAWTITDGMGNIVGHMHQDWAGGLGHASAFALESPGMSNFRTAGFDLII
jgi:hypothetical protein